ncbi:uncharacterized protein LOC131668020 [Phymastichus coffea]|uniref:uncharacterized protein LOC131668020 n=1 Tax=Phymastichus coffea TaxID=108790 RepID=UPI00273AEB21|nr:uncharacterized protein LOC131668020 [Phymastichus coffea]
MVRSTLYPPLPPVSPVQLALISSPPPRPMRPRALPMSPAHTRSLLLAAARPRYPVSYIALTREPRELKLALKLATVSREPGPVRMRPTEHLRHVMPNPKSPTLSRCPPLSFEKTCPCPISRRCGNWKPSPPMPKYYSPPYVLPRTILEIPATRLAKALAPPPPIDVTLLTRPSLLITHHALKRRRPRPA